MTAATPADGDGAGGGSSHPDVTEQKGCFRQWRNAATSVGEGGCVQLSLHSEEEERKSFACSRKVWIQTMTSPLEPHTPSLAWSRAALMLTWPCCEERLFPHAIPAAAPPPSPAHRSSLSLSLDTPRLSGMCQISSVRKAGMLLSPGCALLRTALDPNLASCSTAPILGSHPPCLPIVGAKDKAAFI